MTKADGDLTSSPTDTANIFCQFYANLADGLLKLLPKPKNIFGIASVLKFYQDRVQGKSFFPEVSGRRIHPKNSERFEGIQGSWV